MLLVMGEELDMSLSAFLTSPTIPKINLPPDRVPMQRIVVK